MENFYENLAERCRIIDIDAAYLANGTEVRIMQFAVDDYVVGVTDTIGYEAVSNMLVCGDDTEKESARLADIRIGYCIPTDIFNKESVIEIVTALYEIDEELFDEKI